MNLREARVRFTELSVLLIAKAKELGYEPAWDDIKSKPYKMKCPLCGGSIMSDTPHMDNSLHEYGCALDLILYKNGEYCPEEKDYKEIGEYWKSLDPNCKWGGDFSDGNHFSFAPIEIFGGRA